MASPSDPVSVVLPVPSSLSSPPSSAEGVSGGGVSRTADRKPCHTQLGQRSTGSLTIVSVTFSLSLLL